MGLLAVIVPLWLPFLTVTAEGERVFVRPFLHEAPVQIHFIHSVQKTPVEENLLAMASSKEFRLVSTKYQSFGVGLPFLAEEGHFRQEGEYFILDGMDRRFKNLSLRTGLGTKLTVTVSETEIPLYQKYEPGTRVDLSIEQGYRVALDLLTKGGL